MEQLAFTISEACSAARIGRTSLYEAIKNGDLVAAKYGRKTLIRVDDLKGWLARLPTITTDSVAQSRSKPLASRGHAGRAGSPVQP
jgi:excisionase family DNA binding protein